MNNIKRFLISLLVVLVIWLVFSWPLPRYMFSGIPYSHRNLEKYHFRAMVAGDHLQLLYQFQLLGDMLAGKTPLFENCYEFNTGDDKARYKPEPYYIPFSLIYVIGALLGGQAFGLNVTGFLSLLFTYWLIWQLARRYTDSEWCAALAALIGLAVPYRWITLMCGSPTGFGMTLVPAVFLGIDIAVREQRLAGGILGGVAVFLAYCSDLHVFYFSILAIPFWCIVALAAKADFKLTDLKEYLRLAYALAPVAVLAVVSLLISTAVRGNFSGTDLAKGRGIDDVARCSPIVKGLFTWEVNGVANHVFLGIALCVVLVLGLAMFVVRCAKPERFGSCSPSPQPRIFGAVPLPRGERENKCSIFGRYGHRLASAFRITPPPEGEVAPIEVEGRARELFNCIVPAKEDAYLRRKVVVTALLCLGILVVIALSLGVHGPFHGKLMEFVRDTVPKYKMIRQPMKIYVLLPTLIAVAGAIVFESWLIVFGKKRWVYVILGVLTLAVVIEDKFQIDPTICLLADRQAAYQAVRDDAQVKGKEPRMVVIPLWPGDSHFSALYEHYVSLYRIRMVNGYSPIKSDDYFKNVFKRFESINAGEISDDQLESLGKMGIEYVLLHEDPFPGKVSPWPSTLTLKRFFDHPRLALLKQEHGAWAFRILKPGETKPETALDKRCREINGLWDFDLSQRKSLAPGESLEIPAPALFHSGFTDPDDNSLVFLKTVDPDRRVLWGTLMSLDPGEYSFVMEYKTAAELGTNLGQFTIAINGAEVAGASAIAGVPCVINYHLSESAQSELRFTFSRNADIRILKFSVSRIK